MHTFSFEEIGNVTATFWCDAEVKGGEPVRPTGSGVGLCMDGDKFCGIAGKPQDHVVGVQMRGFVKVPFSGEMYEGDVGLVADGHGGVKVGNGTSIFVIKVNREEKTAWIFM